MTTEPPKRRWFQFRLRTLLIAILVLSLPLSWFAVRMEKARRQREKREAIERLGGEIHFAGGRWDTTTVKFNTEFGHDEASCVAGLPHLVLFLDHTNTTDAGLEHLKGLDNIVWVSLNHTHISDAGLRHIGELTNLESLCLDGTRVTDAGLKFLVGLSDLSFLTLDNTQVTDAGLEHLHSMSNLKNVSIVATRVSPEGWNTLHERLPDCMIRYDRQTSQMP